MVCVSHENVTKHGKVLNTDHFDLVIGTHFLRSNPLGKLLSWQRRYALHCDYFSGLFCIPLVFQDEKESCLRHLNRSFLTENYHLARRCPGTWTGRPAGRPE